MFQSDTLAIPLVSAVLTDADCLVFELYFAVLFTLRNKQPQPASAENQEESHKFSYNTCMVCFCLATHLFNCYHYIFATAFCAFHFSSSFRF